MPVYPEVVSSLRGSFARGLAPQPSLIYPEGLGTGTRLLIPLLPRGVIHRTRGHSARVNYVVALLDSIATDTKVLDSVP